MSHQSKTHTMILVTQAMQDSRVRYSRSWVYKLVKRHKVMGAKISGRVYVDLSDLIVYQLEMTERRNKETNPTAPKVVTVAQANRQARDARDEKPYLPQRTGRHPIPNIRQYEQSVQASQYSARLGFY